MDLSQNTPQNVEYMIDEIKTTLKFMNFGAVNGDHFDAAMYEELRDIYEMVKKKGSFSPREMEAIAEELGKLRK